ncbi:DUF5405 family protein [Pantoea sp. App145]|uniref:DUF5405 family protein n=1 Tax=Pantoea sp. App145 TaxID=3071567 RepID=UPI003A802944
MRVSINSSYFVRALESNEPGKPQKLALEKSGWQVIDGVREQVPVTMAVYDSRILLIRDLASDMIGQLVFRGQMNNVTSFVAETRRIAEQAEFALLELAKSQAKNG